MKGLVYINDKLIGEVDLKILDKSMGVIGGDLRPTSDYREFEAGIKQCCEQKGIANIIDYNFSVRQENNYTIETEGGIGITHSAEFEEIFIEVCGVSPEIILECE